ncbi:hypothetical protein [Arthrobacter sp. VKM Ac-2550]|uniref:hypothetical protein n=1 Tax=Crystallibacter permensis TaxID=1938888 RepID=UPI00222691BF|nr:hypothetical protein [Arthrobacter sp. VKM Ac-2550]MCW2132925.1 hypothetical protein [Arthrobacter sp. VKM Ac-2550]
MAVLENLRDASTQIMDMDFLDECVREQYDFQSDVRAYVDELRTAARDDWRDTIESMHLECRARLAA